MKTSVNLKMSGNLVKTFVLITVAIFVLFCSSFQNSITDQFILQEDSSIFIPIDLNHAGHVYPYMASTVTLSCLLIVVMLIICLGGQLG